MAFTWERIHKWEHIIEDEITDWACKYVEEFYGVDDTDNLTVEQINEIEDFVENPNSEHYLMCVGLRHIISSWNFHKDNEEWENENQDLEK